MYIRCVKKQLSKTSKTFYQYTLAQTSRIDGKVKQHSILYLGSETLLASKDNRATILDLLKNRIYNHNPLIPIQASKELVALADQYFEKYLLKYGDHPEQGASIPPAPDKADFHHVDIDGLEVADARSFGAEHLCKHVLDKLGLENALAELGFLPSDACKSMIAIAGRALFCASEHKTAQLLSTSSELNSCYNYNKSISHKQLYTIADQLYDHKEEIDKWLYKRVVNLFNLKDTLVIFDISNTYFETRKDASKMAKRGRSKEKRSDCPIVVFTGVINEAGFIRHSRIYQGNTPDVLTLKDMLDDLERHSPEHRDKTIVMDAGIASEANLSLIREKDYKYVCVSRTRLKDYSIDDTDATIHQLTDRGKNKVELSIFNTLKYNDTWMYVQSEAKRKKEQSMDTQLCERYEEMLKSIQSGIYKKGGTKTIDKVWLRIGRAQEKYKRISGQYKITVTQDKGTATEMQWVKEVPKEKEDKAKGIYFLRTNYTEPSEKQLWEIYNTIRDVEATFRCLKTDLNMRPVHHQKDKRIESHIYLTILAYQLINTVRYMLKENGINHDWKNILRIMNTQKIQTVILPTPTKDIHIRLPSKAIKQVQEIYAATKCTATQKATKKYVVYH